MNQNGWIPVAKWAPTSCKCSINPYKWLCKWLAGVITYNPYKWSYNPILITGDGPTLWKPMDFLCFPNFETPPNCLFYQLANVWKGAFQS